MLRGGDDARGALRRSRGVHMGSALLPVLWLGVATLPPRGYSQRLQGLGESIPLLPRSTSTSTSTTVTRVCSGVAGGSGAGQCIASRAIQRLVGLDATNCCAACAAYPSHGCGGWEVQEPEGKGEPGVCALKAPNSRRRPCHNPNLPNTTASGVLGEAPAPAPMPGPSPPAPAPPTPPVPGPKRYAVSVGNYTLDGFLPACGADHADVFYPSDGSGAPLPGPFPVLSYGHGSGGNVRGMSALIDMVAGMGMIVLAPAKSGQRRRAEESPPGEGCGSVEWQDMTHVISGSKALASPPHPALVHADWTRTGIFGHSMGGENTCFAANAAQSIGGFGLRAMLSSHSWFRSPLSVVAAKNVSVPSMFTACDGDMPSHAVKPVFEACPARPKVFANLANGSHMEPEHEGRNNPFDAHFLACHVADYQPSCDLIYKDTPLNLCKQEDYVDCDVIPASKNVSLEADDIVGRRRQGPEMQTILKMDDQQAITVVSVDASKVTHQRVDLIQYQI